MRTVGCVLGACASLVLAGTALAEVPRVEFPLGPVVRAGRPLVVRVRGAERVRAPGTPWALPQGQRGDEFLLQDARPEGGRLTFRIRIDGAEHDVGVDVREAGAERLTGVLDDSALADGDVRVPATRLPTLREAWLAFDDVRGSFGGASGAISAALAAWRADGMGAGGLEPFLLPPSISVHRAAAGIARDAPTLPGDVRTVLLLLAATELLLVLLLRRDGDGRRWRAVWLAAPPLAALAWLLVGPGPPGALRATVVVLTEPRGRVALLLVEARRAGDARFELPASAGPAALVRFAPDGGGVTGVATGTAVEVALAAGESRLFAYRLPPVDLPEPDAAGAADPEGRPPRELRRWLAGLGRRATRLRSKVAIEAAFEDALPVAVGARVIPSAALAVERED